MAESVTGDCGDVRDALCEIGLVMVVSPHSGCLNPPHAALCSIGFIGEQKRALAEMSHFRP